MSAQSAPKLLAGIDVERLAVDPSIIVALDRDADIVWVNDAWLRFARENRGESILERFGPGASYLSAIEPKLRGFFQTAFENVLMTGEPFELDYECSSADTFRLFHMLVVPIGRAGLLIVHSRLVERPQHRWAEPENDPVYRQPNGIIVQCANCRRVRRADRTGWDWVPAYVDEVPNRTSHGICSFCRAYYWGARGTHARAPL